MRTAEALIVTPFSRSKIHRVQQLLLHFALGDGAGAFQQAVGQRALAVIDVRDDAEIADLCQISCHSSRYPASDYTGPGLLRANWARHSNSNLAPGMAFDVHACGPLGSAVFAASPSEAPDRCPGRPRPANKTAGRRCTNVVHQHQTGGHRDFIVGQRRRRKQIAIRPAPRPPGCLLDICLQGCHPPRPHAAQMPRALV